MGIITQTTTTNFADSCSEKAEEASRQKKGYMEELKKASGDDVFKYILLINVSAVEEYVAQTRRQADQSFQLSRVVALGGFALLVIGIALSFYLSFEGRTTLEAAYLSAIAGTITEFISGIFFYLYNRTLQQLNRFHDKLTAMQQTSMSFLGSSSVSDQSLRDQTRANLSSSLMDAASDEVVETPNTAVERSAPSTARSSP